MNAWWLPNTALHPREKFFIGIISGQALKCGFGPLLNYEDEDYNAFVGLSEKDVHRLELAAQIVSAEIGNCIDTYWYSSVQPFGRRLLASRESNIKIISFDHLSRKYKDLNWLSAAAMTVVPCAYGGVHLAALSIVFPTQMERMFWKVNCYLLIGYAGAALLGIMLRALIKIADQRSRNWSRINYFFRIISEWFDDPLMKGNVFVSVVAALMLVPYMSARSYIVFESFVSLRHVPVGVFETPDLNFMNYILHL